jgi:hypothetical protein
MVGTLQQQQKERSKQKTDTYMGLRKSHLKVSKPIEDIVYKHNFCFAYRAKFLAAPAPSNIGAIMMDGPRVETSSSNPFNKLSIGDNNSSILATASIESTDNPTADTESTL